MINRNAEYQESAQTKLTEKTASVIPNKLNTRKEKRMRQDTEHNGMIVCVRLQEISSHQPGVPKYTRSSSSILQSSMSLCPWYVQDVGPCL